MSPKATPSAGFTLMEMMIALLVGAVVVTPLFIITRGMTRQTETQRMDVEAMQRARLGIDAIIRDFSRAGSFVCVNTETDPLCRNKLIAGSAAQWRSAVVHLNRGGEGPDTVLLAGNFIGGVDNFQGSSWYTGRVLDGTNIIFPGNTSFTNSECTEQFNPAYSFAHIKTTSDISLDAKVASVAFDGGECTLTLAAGDLDARWVKPGDTVYVAANQTALYFVETTGNHRNLVRYFVNYKSDATMGTTCTAAGATAVADITLPGDSEVDELSVLSRKVLAEYVEDFQVWFRPASSEGTGPSWLSPHQYTFAGIVDENAGNFANGLFLSDAAYVFPRNVDDDPVANTDDIGCSVAANRTYGAEHVRSVVIRLSVRTEKTDQNIDFTAFSVGENRTARFTLSGYTAPDGGVVEDKPGAAYHLKTVVSEVSMNNLAASARLIVQ